MILQLQRNTGGRASRLAPCHSVNTARDRIRVGACRGSGNMSDPSHGADCERDSSVGRDGFIIRPDDAAIVRPRRHRPNFDGLQLVPLEVLKGRLRRLATTCRTVLRSPAAPKVVFKTAAHIQPHLGAVHRLIAWGGRRAASRAVAEWRRQLATAYRRHRSR
jgi:hypothetical protein